MPRTVTRTTRRRFAAPATKKKKKKKGGDDDNPQDGATAFYRAILDAPRKTRPNFSEEEAQRNFEIGARYNKLSRIKHCEFEASLQLKLDLQQYALESLPPDLRKQAMSLEDVPLPPLDRRPTTYSADKLAKCAVGRRQSSHWTHACHEFAKQYAGMRIRSMAVQSRAINREKSSAES